MTSTTEATTVECHIAVENPDAYTEVSLLDDGTIRLHVEDSEDAAEPIYTLEEAEALMASLGAMIFKAKYAS